MIEFQLELEHWHEPVTGLFEPDLECTGEWIKKRDVVVCTGCDAYYAATDRVLARAGTENYYRTLIESLADSGGEAPGAEL